jgi:hypothetical protein
MDYFKRKEEFDKESREMSTVVFMNRLVQNNNGFLKEPNSRNKEYTLG